MMKRILIITMIACAIFFVGFRINTINTQKAEWENNREIITVVVCHGDTLYDYANEHRPSWMDTREYIYEIEQLNNMNNCNIYAGQTIKLYTVMEG